MLSYNYLDQNINQVENIQSRYALEHIRNHFILGIDMMIVGRLKESEDQILCQTCGYLIDKCRCVCPYCGEVDTCTCCVGYECATGG